MIWTFGQNKGYWLELTKHACTGYKVKNAMTLTYACIDSCGAAKDMGTRISCAAY